MGKKIWNHVIFYC